MPYIVFNYLFLLCALYMVYWIMPVRWRAAILFIGSFAFYGAISFAFSIHFLFLLLVNFLAIVYQSAEKKKWMLMLFAAINILNLAAFKYLYSIAEIPVAIHGTSGADNFISRFSLAIGVPLFVTFSAFQLIAFQVDAYRDRLKPPLRLIDFLAFNAFFPGLLAGAARSDFGHQLRTRPSEKEALAGVLLIGLGLLKIFVSGTVFQIFHPVLHDPLVYNGMSNVIAAAGLLVCLIFSFSALRDVACGSTRILGIELARDPSVFRVSPAQMGGRPEFSKVSYKIAGLAALALVWSSVANLRIGAAMCGQIFSAEGLSLEWPAARSAQIAILAALFVAVFEMLRPALNRRTDGWHGLFRSRSVRP